jgi:eukaryotic-like serine/threonine-protein kinase
VIGAGTRLGPYEILSPLGAGGMGEVWRARDDRLKRDVAIKVLPASFSKDPERLRRFELEAQAAGSLNHPGITAVYDFGTHEGAPYIVTELLEGETLRARIAAGALPSRKALDYAAQLARGLAAAHEKGIVHRDLKPENVFVTRDGRVKILDFGLAKLKESELPEAGHTHLPTEAGGTEPGVVLGTMGYMSPEQVRGRPADRRSDIFSFGAILYEMLSGQRAFRADTAADTITAILRKEPPDLSQANRDVPPGLERIVRHCLEKNPEERFESARDLAFDLEALSGISGSAPAVPSLPAAAARLRRPIVLPLVVLVALAGMAAAYFAGKKAGYVKPPSFRQITFRRGQIQSARFAPDGQTILYSAAWEGRPVEIFVSRLESPESRPFGLAGAEVLSLSPSGEMAVSLGRRTESAFTRTGTLARIGMTGGGSPKEVLEDVQSADWAPDGQSLAIVRDIGGKARLEFPAGKVFYETAGWISHPRVSPRGDEIAFLDHPLRGDDGGSVAVVDRSGKKRTVTAAFASAMGLAWSPRGDEVWFTAAPVGFNRGLYAVTGGGSIRELAQATGGLTIQDISRNGRVLIVQDKARQGISALLPGAEKERDFSWLDWSLLRDISSDGQTILFDETGEGGGAGYSVHVRRADGSPAVRLGEGAAWGLSPDGRTALAISGDVPKQKIVLYPIGAGESRSLPLPGLRVEDGYWLPDGRRIVFAANEPDRGVRLWIQGIDEQKPRAVSPEGYRLLGKTVSPDGRLVVVRGPDRRVYFYPIDGGEPTPVQGLEANEAPAGWSSGNILLIRRRGEVPARIRLLDARTGHTEFWKQFLPQDAAGVSSIGGVAVTPDRRWYAYSYVRSLADLYVMEGLK